MEQINLSREEETFFVERPKDIGLKEKTQYEDENIEPILNVYQSGCLVGATVLGMTYAGLYLTYQLFN